MSPNQMIKDSDVDTGVKPQTSNKILTLSTCTGNGYSKRLAIHAVCIDAQTTDESKIKGNRKLTMKNIQKVCTKKISKKHVFG